MGTWSSGLYGNDTTLDVRDSYTNYLLKQFSNQEAFEKTLDDYKELIGNKEEPLFWFALAETQWKVGRLTSGVKGKALEWISKNGGVALWEDSGADSAGWKKTLLKLKEKIESPMPREKKMEVLNQNLWNIGDVYAYQFNKEKSKELGRYGKYVVLQKIGAGPSGEPWMTQEELAELPVMMIIHVFNKLFDEMPMLSDIEDIQLLPASNNYLQEEIFMSKHMMLQKKRHYPEKHLFYMGNAPTPANNFPPSRNYTFWDEIEKSLNFCFSEFQNREYEEVEEGIYKFKN